MNSIKRNYSNFSYFSDNQKNLKNLSEFNSDISATSISDITGIPRATCIRKLDKFVKMKVLQKNSKTKKSYSKKGNHVDIQIFDSSDMKAAIKELKKLQEDFSKENGEE